MLAVKNISTHCSLEHAEISVHGINTEMQEGIWRFVILKFDLNVVFCNSKNIRVGHLKRKEIYLVHSLVGGRSKNEVLQERPS